MNPPSTKADESDPEADLGAGKGVRKTALGSELHSPLSSTDHPHREEPVFQPARPIDPAEVERVHKDIITRLRRVLERHDLNPLALGLPPRAGDEVSPEQHDSPKYSQPLLDFGEAQEGSFLPGLKAASVQSAVPFGPRAGQPLRRLLDLDLARAYATAGWSDGSQRAAPPLVTNAHGFSLHAATRVAEGNRSQLEKLCRYVTRPAICLKRLEVRSGGMISWSSDSMSRR